MQAKQMVVIVSRALCFWFVYQAVMGLIAIPSFIQMEMLWSRMQTSQMIHNYLPAHSMAYLWREAIETLLRIAFEIVLAVMFYRCGPMITKFLSGGFVEENSDNLISPSA